MKFFETGAFELHEITLPARVCERRPAMQTPMAGPDRRGSPRQPSAPGRRPLHRRNEGTGADALRAGRLHVGRAQREVVPGCDGPGIERAVIAREPQQRTADRTDRRFAQRDLPRQHPLGLPTNPRIDEQAGISIARLRILVDQSPPYRDAISFRL